MNLLSKLFPAALLLFCLSLTCCKKNHGRYSKWYVGTDSFSINSATVYQGRQVYSLSDYGGNTNGFAIGFEYTPSGSRYPIRHVPGPNPDSAGIGFYYHTRFYKIASSNRNYLLITTSDGKRVFTLPEGWFVNYDDALDSVLIKGLFCEP